MLSTAIDFLPEWHTRSSEQVKLAHVDSYLRDVMRSE
jgi:hypothetical protein